MPVGTQGTVKAVPQDTLESLGAEIILGNTYHLYLRPGHEAIRRMGGLHRFISWPRALLTDSGGFQVYSLSQLRKVTDDGVQFRSHLDGSLHFFTPEHSDGCADRTRRRHHYGLRRVHRVSRRLALAPKKACASPWPGPLARSTTFAPTSTKSPGMNKGCPIQALLGRDRTIFRSWEPARNPSLASCRAACTPTSAANAPSASSRWTSTATPLAVLSVGEPRELTLEMIAEVLPLLPKDKPRYVMGVGYPDEIEQYARMGVDMMDCVLPTRAARHGLLFTSEGRLNIKNKQYAEDQNPPDPACSCPDCRRYSRAYLRHLMQAGEPLAATLNSIHNLAFYLGIMQRVRASLEALPPNN